MITPKATEKIISIARLLLPEDIVPTRDIIRDSVFSAITALRQSKYILDLEEGDEDKLVREIEAQCNVYIPTVTTLDDMRGHQEWLPSRRADIQWRFWDRYRAYLGNNLQLPPQVVQRLDEVSDQILGRLENPQRSGSWDRRGMVVGQVQSGKTSNYTALICKAADAGYKLIVVLTGIHNSLRSQTQLRLDEAFLGFDTQKRSLFDPDNIRLGVGLLPGTELYHVHSLTNSAEKGDFKLNIARQAHVMIGGTDPVLLVIKKNASVLSNLVDWSKDWGNILQGSSQTQVKGIPLLLIDDEADNASINTNPILDQNGRPDPEADPSKINGLIRKLLNSFEQSAYVGYTATPFANIFIADKDINDEFGEDLFPRSFIINLQPPSNYLGPARLFGLTKDALTDREIASGLPLICSVKDHLEWVPDKHKKDHHPGPLPRSVKKAIKAFVLTCATRYARGQIQVHNSMLIHVTRFTAVQKHVADQVQDELSFLQQRLRYGDGHAPGQILDELKNLWFTDFEPTMQKFGEPDLIPVTWDQVKKVLYSAASKIEVKKINGTAKDTLQYVEHKDGLSVICIGGDKLSRGLTLEGLSISYYLRASNMYDTLMQMGRWFGYRNGYIDICRLYTTSELEGRYRDITAADEELRLMFEDMAEQGKTPEDYGLGVKKHPDGLLVTAPTKMRYAQHVLLSYAEHIVETVVFSESTHINQQNFLTTQQLILHIDTRYSRLMKNGNHVWNNVDGHAIAKFLAAYTTHEAARKVQSSLLTRYIQGRITDNELTSWTVVLVSNQRKVNQGITCTIANLNVGLTERTPLSGNESSNSAYRIRRLVSPADEWIDLSEEEKNQAMEETKRRWEKDRGKSKNNEPPEEPSGLMVRRTRPATRGLLLLYTLGALDTTTEPSSVSESPVVGFAISFPKSNRPDAAAIAYVVNTVWQQELKG